MVRRPSFFFPFMFNADSCFFTGSTHSICQDYAATLITPRITVAAVADGCSGSPHTDIGARILVQAALTVLQTPLGENAWRESRCYDAFAADFTGRDPLGDMIIARAQTMLQTFQGIDPRALDATLGLIIGDVETDNVDVLLWGDGAVVCADLQEGTQAIWVNDYVSGAPFYLNYRTSRSRSRAYHADSGHLQATERFAQLVPTIHAEDLQVEPTRKRDCQRLRVWNFNMPDDDEVRVITVMTDGVGTFGHEPDIIASEVSEYKRANGDFLRARMKFFARASAKIGRNHGDDFGIAALAMSQNVEAVKPLQ